MTQIELDRANYIKTVLDKINSVMYKNSDGHRFFRDDMKYENLGWLAFYELEDEFLELLDRKKRELEHEFENM